VTTVRVCAAGGTIASEPGEGGAAPAKTGAELVEAVPDVEEHADLTVTDVASYPGFDMRFEAVVALARAVAATDPDEVAGVVVTHGTDTLAETARALDLLCAGAPPVVVTGAQWRFDEPGTDAPSNLLTAVRTAADGRFEGSFVAFDDAVYAAGEARKVHASARHAFDAPGRGPVASVDRSAIRLHRSPTTAAPTLPTPEPDALADVTVPVVHSGISAGAGTIERALAAGVDGIVVAGTGLGNTTTAIGDAVAAAADEVPVVVATRCPAGHTDQVYGTGGGGVTLRSHGALFGGAQSPAIARVTLALALAAGTSRDRLAELFA
jgi:L-asparaginase